jgi:two-component system response regulator NreC
MRISTFPRRWKRELEAGVMGYVLKSQAASDLVQAIGQVSRGQFYLSPGVSSAVAQAFRSKSEKPRDPLTSRERQVLQLIAEGKSTKDVASLLGISVKTAESHRTRLMQKLDIHETASLVRYAVRRGIVEP